MTSYEMPKKGNSWGIFSCYLPVDFKFVIKYASQAFTQIMP